MKMKLMFLCLLMLSGTALAKSDVNFSGTLVEEPCTLSPDDTNITVDFGSVVLKSLYSNKRSVPQLFALHLVDCDTSLGNQVKVTFSGVEDADQPGLLAPDGSSTATGVAVGLETLHGELIPINNPSGAFPLQDGTSTLHLAAFVQASDQAIAANTLQPGSLSAVATFEFTYD